LPPIESITADTDIRAFLAPGVPSELTLAALRRAWIADPKIRDFVGLADYDWDFNAAKAATGFGPLELTDDLRDQVVQMFSGGLGKPLPGDDRAGLQSEAPASINPPAAEVRVALAPAEDAMTQEPHESSEAHVLDPRN